MPPPLSAALCLLALQLQGSLALRAQAVSPSPQQRLDLEASPPQRQLDLVALSRWALEVEAGLEPTPPDAPAPPRHHVDPWPLEEGIAKNKCDKPANRTYRKAPLFHKCAARFAEDAARSCGGQGCDVVFVGDSIIERLTGYQCYGNKTVSDMKLSKVIPADWRAHVLAGTGDQTQHTLGHLSRCLPRLRAPKLFVVSIGTNNIGPFGGFPANSTAIGVKAVARALRQAHPTARVLLHAMLPRSDVPVQEMIDEINAELRAWQEPGVQFVDCSTVFPKNDPRALQELMPDLLHPSEVGYAKWFQCLRPVMAQELGLPGTMPAS